MIRLGFERGRRLPLHAGASSKILLAFQNDEFMSDYVEQKGMENMTKNTFSDPNSLFAEMKYIREKGYALSDSEVDDGAKAVAAPIFDHDERLAAGLTIVGPTDRILFENRDKLIGMVTEIAQRISSEIGFLMGIDGQPGGIDG